MVRNYKCKYEKVQGENVRQALQWMAEDPIFNSERKASEIYGVTRSVLQRWKKRDAATIPEVLSQGSIKKVFTEAQENVILQYSVELADKFYGMTRCALAELAYKLASANNIDHRFKNGVAGPDWVSSFLCRHKDKISVRTGSPLSVARHQAFTKPNVYRFFDQLEAVVGEKEFTASTIFNMDETGVSVVSSRPSKVLARKGIRSVPVLVAAERGQLVTITCCASASGKFIPPMFILPKYSKYVETESAPLGSVFFKSPKGWSTTEAFLFWLKHFRKRATENSTTPVLLILDGHSSHVTYEAVTFCTKNNIDLLTLPPHTSHKTQPLDISFFSPLKSYYGKALTQWQMSHRGRKARTEDIPGIIKTAYDVASTESNAKSGFAKTGIFVELKGGPDRCVFSDDEFTEQEDSVSTDLREVYEIPDEDDPNSGNAQLPSDSNNEGPFQNIEDRDESSEREFFETRGESGGDNLGLTTSDTDQHDTEMLLNLSEGENVDAVSSSSHGCTRTVGSFPAPSTSKKIILDRSRKSLVDYSSSSSDEEYLEDDDNTPGNPSEFIYSGRNEPVFNSEDIEAVIVHRFDDVEENSRAFDVTPWDLETRDISNEAVSTRKVRPRQQSEVLTSEENYAKLKEKNAKKRKQTSSDSDERRQTRNATNAQKRVLRSGSKQ